MPLLRLQPRDGEDHRRGGRQPQDGAGRLPLLGGEGRAAESDPMRMVTTLAAGTPSRAKVSARTAPDTAIMRAIQRLTPLWASKKSG